MRAVATRPVVVVGLMGSGKTSVAQRLAEALRRPMRDSDEELEASYGQSAAEQYAAVGAAILHEREGRQLREALQDPRLPVIAAAASVVENPSLRRELRQAYVVWLDASPRVLADRMRDGAHRPHFEQDLSKMLASQHQRRAGWFQEVADLRVDVAEPGPDEVAATVLESLR